MQFRPMILTALLLLLLPGAVLAERVRGALQAQTSNSINAVFDGTRECPWVVRELKSPPRPLPGLR